MLQLQRASAGSGKTYALAKKFIWCLITTSVEGEEPRLRSHSEIIDALPRILAITFTNKATNEMKQRIVDKLAALAAYRGEGRHPDYLDEFISQLGCPAGELSRTCAGALSALLNDYSDFKVSTIDSFFQTVLRTFAYETDISDSYQIELDNDYLAAAAIDLLFDDINHRRNLRAEYWLSHIMTRDRENGRAWNAFRRDNSRTSTYGQVLAAVMKLDNEDYKMVREALGQYLERRHDLPDIYDGFNRRISSRIRSLHADAADAARALQAQFAAAGVDIHTQGRAYMASQLIKVITADPMTAPSAKFIDWSDGKPAVKVIKKATKKTPAIYACDTTTALALTDAAVETYAVIEKWLGYLSSPEVVHWRAYDRLMPFLGLLLEAQEYIRQLLEAGNMLQLGETNSILRRIIGDDDTPFVYERLGTRLDHYLIDEFQDTSRLQWGNLRPLLHESESRGNYNLMIGDAKQSTYRFRNADPTLITDVVPRDFPLRVPDGDLRQENTNWRSRRTVVEFNNLFFKALSALLPHDGSDVGHLPELYSNTVQYPHHRDRSGYIEINFISDNSDSSDNSDNSDPSDNPSPLRYPYLGPLLSSLHSRGYRWRDMAVLVATNNDGTAAIDSLVAYNATLAEGETPVEFISEESLRVSSAKSVRTVISALQALDNNRDPKKIFNFYTMQHPEMDSAQILARWFPGGRMIPGAPSPLTEMLEGMQTVALPALVEEIIQTFVSHELRRSEAMFLAAFEDLVMAFCEGHAADVSSFLEWWRVKGEKTPVSSPEGADAVQVMTVHKSKGLEFRCVILPDANQALRSSGRRGEWRWVRPSPQLDPQHTLPDFLPVITDSSLEGTDHENELREFHDLYTMDKVNQYYVAFTRAVDELYVFTSLDKGKGDSRRQTRELGKEYKLGQCLREVFVPDDGTLCLPDDDGADADMLLPPGLVRVERDGDRILRVAVGAPCADVAPEGNGDAQGAETFDIDEYSVSRVRFDIKYRSAGRLPAEKEGDGEEEDPEELDRDPRSEGNLMHSVLENVAVASDLPRAVRILETKGLLTRRAAMETEAFLREAISGAEVRGWFNGEWRVLNERDILIHGQRNLRPDRVMVSADGKRAVVVDYKFGKRPEGNVHRRQVRGYVDAVLAGGLAAEAQGYVWYVREGVVERVADS